MLLLTEAVISCGSFKPHTIACPFIAIGCFAYLWSDTNHYPSCHKIKLHFPWIGPMVTIDPLFQMAYNPEDFRNQGHALITYWQIT